MLVNVVSRGMQEEYAQIKEQRERERQQGNMAWRLGEIQKLLRKGLKRKR